MNIIAKPYESLLPFLVVEVISAKGNSFNSMSVGLIDKGWAWLVSGRRLLIWKFKDAKPSNAEKARRTLSPCFQLQLPQSDLLHRAELIQVFFIPQNPNATNRAVTIPAAIAVSPEGAVRFWSSIANERFAESTVGDIQGQEVCTMAPLSTLEYLVGTTTGSVYILTLDITTHDPKNLITCSPLSLPSGLLSGLGRRVTNLFFGQMPIESGTETRRPLLAIPKYSQSTIEKTGSSDRPFFVMSSTFKLRQWTRTNAGCQSTNQLIREWDLQKEIYLKLVAELRLSDTDILNFWPIDMITTRSKELLMLIVTMNPFNENTVQYATCLFNPYQAGDRISNLTVLRSYAWNCSGQSEDQLFALRFLERRAKSSLSFMFDRKLLFLVQTDRDIYDARDYGNQQDSILGAGIIDGHPILFTQNEGLSYVVPVASTNTSQIGLNDTSVMLEPPRHVLNESRHQRSRMEGDQLSRVDPMVVDIDIDEETEEEVSIRVNQSLQRRELDGSISSNRSIKQGGGQDKSVDQSTRRRDDPNDFWKTQRDFDWIAQIDSKDYVMASESLSRVATESEALKDWRETLLSLSKICRLAAD